MVIQGKGQNKRNLTSVSAMIFLANPEGCSVQNIWNYLDDPENIQMV